MIFPFSLISFLLPPAPCPPEDVEPVLDCSNNTARVEWQASRGAEFYIVQASGVEELKSGCKTDSLSCLLTELSCGFTYNISVVAVNSACNVSQSATTQLKAGNNDQRINSGLTARWMLISQIMLIQLEKLWFLFSNICKYFIKTKSGARQKPSMELILGKKIRRCVFFHNCWLC